MRILALFAFPLSAVWSKKEQKRIAQLVFCRVNTQDLVLNIKVSDDLTSSVKNLVNASKSNIGLVTDSLVVTFWAVSIEADIEIMKAKSLLLINLQKTLKKHSCLMIIE
jgi:hypothetical protein